MRQSLKISLSLLVSLVVFAAFAVLAFLGLFDRLQVTFFQPRVLREREKSLAAAAELIEHYHRLNLDRFIEPLKQPYILSAFSRIGQESREDIFNRGNYFGKLLDEYPSLQGVRFLSAEGKIHFSTFPADVRSKDKDQIGYYPYQEVEKGEKALPVAALLAPQGGVPQLLIDGQANRLIYSYPVADPRGGTAVFYFSKNGLAESLLRDPRLEFRELALIDRLGVVLNVPESEKGLLAPVVVQAWGERGTAGLSSQTVVLSGEGGASEKDILLSQPAGRFGLVGWLVPYASFELQPLMKAVILASVLLTVFLLVFLLFNLRQDPLLVLSQRVKRFQLQILQEFIEGRKEVDWQRWRDELAGGRPELRSRIKKGIGRLPAGKEAEIDGLIDRSWDEIIRIIEARIGQQARERVDIGAVEQLIQKALDRGRITLEAATAAAATLPAVTPAPARAAPPRRQGLQVEEIGVEEVTEAEEARAPAAGAREARPQEAVEELEEVEPAEEAEEIGGAEGEAQAEEPVEEVEALEAEAVEEIPEAEEAEAVEEAGAERIPEAEEAAEEAEVIEALPVVEVEEAGPAEAAASQAPAARAVAQAEALTEAAEALEELEPMRELEALPLEPQEQLEELPEAEPAPPRPTGPPVPAAPEEMPRELEELEAEAPAAPAVSAGPEARPAAETQAEEPEPEELIGLEEVPAALQEPPEAKQQLETAAAPGRSLPELVGKGLIRIFTLSEVAALVAEARASVVMQNGVYQVKEELRVGTPSARDKRGGKGLKALAEEVLSSGGEAPPAEDVSGISELLGGDVGLDLATELEGLRAKAREARLPDRQRVKKIQFYGDGLDYDQYLNQFGNGSSETEVLKSLVEISRKLKAVSAAMLQKEGQSFSSVLRVGLMDKPEAVRFAAGEPFYERFLKERQTVLILERPAQIPALAGKFHAEDLRYMQGALFLPAVYQRAPAFLFLGLPTKKGLSLKEIIAKLDIY